MPLGRGGRRSILLQLILAAALSGMVGCASVPPAAEAPPPVAEDVPRTWSAPPVIENRRLLGDTSTSNATLAADEVLAAAIAFNPRYEAGAGATRHRRGWCARGA
jgi:hypothetical protein